VIELTHHLAVQLFLPHALQVPLKCQTTLCVNPDNISGAGRFPEIVPPSLCDISYKEESKHFLVHFLKQP
jgi:hypothetical protein